MDYNTLLEVAVDLGHALAMSGAETYRVEESARWMLKSYGIESEVFAIPNTLIVSIETPEGKPMTRMRRIGHHGNDLDALERFSNLSRAICNHKPEPKEARNWLTQVQNSPRSHGIPVQLLGDFMGASGIGALFGGSWIDCMWAGVCGMLAGIVTMAASFTLAITAYALAAFGFTPDADSVIIGAVMILVPGLLFTHAMRDIIYGDTNSGVNRIAQVLLIAAAIALGGAVAWKLAEGLWGTPVSVTATNYTLFAECVATYIGCIGFAILFNIQGPAILLTSLGGVITWIVYSIAVDYSGSNLFGFFWGSIAAAANAEIMARVRKCPAIIYLVISIFPLLPGADIYFTMTEIVNKNMDKFATQGMYTLAITGVMAVGILVVSTVVRMLHIWKHKPHREKKKRKV